MMRMHICHNCAGDIIGKINGNILYDSEGNCIGIFNEKDELFNCDKVYIGELATIYVDSKTAKTAMSEKDALSTEKESIVYFQERLIVDFKKIKQKDDSVKCTQPSNAFSKELYETTRAVSVPEGYKDFILK